jgi:hypothetical protein
MKNVVFWDVTPCGSCKNRRFGTTYRLRHQGKKNGRSKSQVSSNWQLKNAGTWHGIACKGLGGNVKWRDY